MMIRHIANDLRQKGYELIPFWGCVTVEQILEAISIKAQSMGLDYAGKIFDAFDESTTKLAWYLEHFLLKQKIAIMFNDFEENQDEEKNGEFKQERLKEFLLLLRDGLENHETLLAFSTRLPLPGFDETGVTAARYFEAMPEEREKPYLHQRIEARRHYLLACEWDRAAEITVELSSYLLDRGYLRGAMELLREMESKELAEKNRAEIHSRMGNIYFEYGEHDQALAQYAQALDIAGKIKDLKNSSRYMYQIGNVYFKTGDYDHALDQYRQALDTGDPNGISNILNQTGIVYHIKGDHDAAFASVKQALEINEKNGDRLEAGRNLRQMGMFYYDKKDYDRAWASFQESMEAYGKIAHFKGVKGVASVLHWLGLICHARGDCDGALVHFHRANEELRSIADFKDMFYNFYQLGIIYHDKGDYETASTNYRKSLETCENIDYKKGLADSTTRLGILYFQRDEYKTALEYFLQAFKHYTNTGMPGANQVREEIGRVRGKLPEEQFNAVLQGFGFDADSFDSEDDREQEEFVEFLAALAREALVVRKKSSEEKKPLSARLDQLTGRLPDDEEGRDLKAYFRLLLAVANGGDYRRRLDEVSEELRELFEEIKDTHG
jgi:tetratricopeptide (TPR) repeat protein